MKIHSLGMSPILVSGLKSCQTIVSASNSTPSSCQSCVMSPFGSGGCWPPNMPIMPPGGCFGWPVPTTLPNELSHGNGSSKIAVGWPDFTACDEVLHRLGRERRRLHGQQHVELLGDRLRRIDFDHVVLLLELGDDLRFLGRALHREAAEELGVGLEHAERLALLAGDGADRADQLVLDRNAAVDERDHDLVEAGAEGDAEEDFLRAADAVVDGRDVAGLDAVGPLGERGGFAEVLDLMDVDDDLAAAQRAEFRERREQVAACGRRIRPAPAG